MNANTWTVPVAFNNFPLNKKKFCWKSIHEKFCISKEQIQVDACFTTHIYAICLNWIYVLGGYDGSHILLHLYLLISLHTHLYYFDFSSPKLEKNRERELGATCFRFNFLVNINKSARASWASIYSIISAPVSKAFWSKK